MTLTEIPAGVHLPKSANPGRDEVIVNIGYTADKLTVIVTGRRTVAVHSSSTHWAKRYRHTTYMRVMTYKSVANDDGSIRWVTEDRITLDTTPA